MNQIIEDLWRLPRDIVSDGYDRALAYLAERLPMTIHEYPTGTPVWTWRIPEKWTCEEAYLETLDGRRLLDYADHPLHVVSYSLPFEGVVGREELLAHLHVHPTLLEAIPFVFKYYERDWGLCASQTLRDSLTDPEYRVVIRTRFEPGTLKVGEIIVPGASEETFVLAAHLCHPHMVNDDLTGVAVLMGVAEALLNGALPDQRYTYRLLIVPETIGSVAYLSHHEDLLPQMVGGLFLEMLGNASPHALQGSFYGDTQVDKTLWTALRGLDPQSYWGDYRTVIGNDERQFNAPGVRVPMLSLSRVEPPASPTRPYREYHSSFDTPEIITVERLEASRQVVLELLRAWEHNLYPANNFKGEIFASGQGIWIDYRINPEGHRVLFRVMEHCDGTLSVAEIAEKVGTTFQAAWDVVSLLAEKGLVRLEVDGRPWTVDRRPWTVDRVDRRLSTVPRPPSVSHRLPSLVSRLPSVSHRPLSIVSRPLVKSTLRHLRHYLRRAAAYARYGPSLGRAPVLFANSFPKSGTHLLTQVLQGFPRLGPAVDAGLGAVVTFEGESGRQRAAAEIVRDLRRLRPGDIGYGHLHALPEVVPLLCRPGVAAYFIVRDPRDIVVSHAHYVAEMAPEHVHHAYYRSLLDFESRLRVSILGLPGADVPFPDIAQRFAPYRGWLEHPEVRLLRFEDFLRERRAALGEVLDHAVERGFPLRIPREEAISRLEGALNPRKSPTFRSGKAGGWREAFTPSIKTLFKETAGDLLIALGYESDNDW